MKKVILFSLFSVMLIGLFWLIRFDEKPYSDVASVSLYEFEGSSYAHESNRTGTHFANTNVSFALLKTDKSNLSLEEVMQRSNQFSPIVLSEKFDDVNTTYWLRIDLGKNFPDGNYVCIYGDMDFSEHSLGSVQNLERYTVVGVHNVHFNYRQSRDAQVYYFKLVPGEYKEVFRFISVYTPQALYELVAVREYFMILFGLIIGLILMAAVYNGAMYYYNRDKAFLYYTLMQIFMVLVLHVETGLLNFGDSFFIRNVVYSDLIALSTAVFAGGFTQHFLQTAQHTPRLHYVINVLIVIIVLDMIIALFDKSWIIEYSLLPFSAMLFVYIGFVRVRQGYEPAYFYLLGWVALAVSLFLTFFVLDVGGFMIDPIYIGAALEAILFSLALSYRIKMIADMQEAQKEVLVHQNKLASMGEMMGNIAHQWRQPLTHLSYIFMNITQKQEEEKLDKLYLTGKMEEATKQLLFMSQTIEDFQNFYTPTKQKEKFFLSDVFQEAMEMMAYSFEKNSIETLLHIEQDIEVESYKNELMQVLLNLLSNAKDAYVASSHQEANINVEVDGRTITITDNAGGIPKEMYKTLFEPYNTTKEKSLGIGLYMAKMIVEKRLEGELLIENVEGGVCCKVILNPNP